MNQILSFKNGLKRKKTFKVILFISLISMFLFTIYLMLSFYMIHKNKDMAARILNTYNLKKIYSSPNYKLYKKLNSSNCSVIGVIEIPKIRINYPILSDATDDSLKVSPCRFYGPLPNEIGNMCIAAHNYDDNSFFSNLKKLELNDEIKIYDINNSLVRYFVYDKFETSEHDISCTNQNTNMKREITLVTCNNINKKRLIIKAKE